MKRKAALFTILALLFLFRVTANYAAQVTAQIENTPAWLPLFLGGLASLAGALMVIVIIALVIVYGRKLIDWLSDLLAAEDEGEESGGASKQARTPVTKDLYQTVASLERHGNQSSKLIDDATSQTAALVEIVKNLQKEAAAMGRKATSLGEALNALQGGDSVEIKRAGGQVQDSHIKSLMLLASEQADDAYWRNVTELVAAQLGDAENWQSNYAQMAASLMAEVSEIKTRLNAASAHITVTEAARPLLQAKVNLDQAANILRIPISETPEPGRLFAPRNEYALMVGE